MRFGPKQLTTTMVKTLKILYSAGPGDVIQTFRHWSQGSDDPTQLSMTYSGMFYEVCRELGAQAYVIGTSARIDRAADGQFLVVHRPTPFPAGPGPLFNVGQAWAALRLIASALWFRADVAVVACGSVSWIVLQLLPILGIPVIPSLHCVLWPKYRKLTPLQRILRRLRVRFFKRSAFRILSASGEITDQVAELTNGRHKPIAQFLPSYRRRQFEGIAPATLDKKPFRVLFAGRIERNKGVFDLLQIATRFAAEGRTDVAFDLCGNGSELEALKLEAGVLGDRFRCHGHCNWQTMRSMYAEAHVVIVPTTGDFVEGFNQVVAEAVLAGRPVITSEVCPAIAYVRDAVVQVAVDDVKSYGDAILRLCDDPLFYQAKRSGCTHAQEQFYDLERSWMAAVRGVLNEIGAAQSTVPAEIPAMASHSS